MPRTHYVTPTLFVGEPPNLPKVASVRTAEAAVTVIEEGGIAVLPAHDWGTAVEVLSRLGVAAPQRERQVHFAKTGTLL